MRYLFINSYSFIIFFLSLVISCAQPTDRQFTFSGKIEGMPDGWLYMTFIRQSNSLDSVAVKGGQFKYKAQLGEKEYFNFFFKGADASTSGFSLMHVPANPGELVTFTGHIDKPSYWKLSGSPDIKLLMSLRSKIQDLENDYLAILKKYEPQKMQIPQEEVSRLIVNTRTRNKIIHQFIDDNAPSDASLLAILYSLNTTVQQADPQNGKALATRFNKSLNDENITSLLAQSLETTFAQIGESTMSTALDFTQNDVNGNPISLSSFKGKYILLDFWASWCGPCRDENPNVAAAYQKFKDKGFDIVAVSLDKSKAAWLKAIKQDNLTWNHLSDLKGWQNSVARLYKIRGIPTNFLLDPKGNIIESNLRGERLHQVLQSVLK